MMHPIQPLVTDNDGVLRFKANAMVQYILDHGGIDLNQLAVKEFSREDREQFAQLIGYSLSGAHDLSYFSNETLVAAQHGNDAPYIQDARAAHLRETIIKARDLMRDGVALLYGVHPDDLQNGSAP